MLREILFLFFCCFSASGLVAQVLEIGLFRASEIQKLSVLPSVGRSEWIFDGWLKYAPIKDDGITLNAEGNKVRVMQRGQTLGRYATVECRPVEESSNILKPLKPDYPEWAYRGNLKFSAAGGILKMVNSVAETDYLAGVLRGETGKDKAPAFYEAMAIMARTYACYYGKRHKSEGFDLCDQTHCQVYKGFYNYKPWFDAAVATRNQVMKDAEGRCAEAVFHANCGGETALASSVWKYDIKGCERVSDPFCLQSKGAVWEKRIEKAEFMRKAELNEHQWQQLKMQSDSISLYCYPDGSRPSAIYYAGVKVNPVRLREKFGLRSAWFDMEILNDAVYFTGRGFGHGVGLCQEGAMEMGRYGCGSEEILLHYFKGIQIVPLRIFPNSLNGIPQTPLN